MSESIDVETRDPLHLWFGFQPDNNDQAKVMIRFAPIFVQFVKDTNDTIKKAELLSQLRFLKAAKHCLTRTLYLT